MHLTDKFHTAKARDPRLSNSVAYDSDVKRNVPELVRWRLHCTTGRTYTFNTEPMKGADLSSFRF